MSCTLLHLQTTASESKQVKHHLYALGVICPIDSVWVPEVVPQPPQRITRPVACPSVGCLFIPAAFGARGHGHIETQGGRILATAAKLFVACARARSAALPPRARRDLQRAVRP